MISVFCFLVSFLVAYGANLSGQGGPMLCGMMVADGIGLIVMIIFLLGRNSLNGRTVSLKNLPRHQIFRVLSFGHSGVGNLYLTIEIEQRIMLVELPFLTPEITYVKGFLYRVNGVGEIVSAK